MTETVWNYKDLLHILKLDEDVELSLTFYVNEDETDVQVIINGGDLFYWACGEAEQITPADIPDIEQCIADLTAVSEDGKYHASELFCCRRVKMRPQGAWYGCMQKGGMVFRRFVPAAIEAVFDAAGPERDNADGKDGDGPKRPRPADGRRWDRGGSKTPEDNPPEFIAMFQEGGEFGP